MTTNLEALRSRLTRLKQQPGGQLKADENNVSSEVQDFKNSKCEAAVLLSPSAAVEYRHSEANFLVDGGREEESKTKKMQRLKASLQKLQLNKVTATSPLATTQQPPPSELKAPCSGVQQSRLPSRIPTNSSSSGATQSEASLPKSRLRQPTAK